MLFPRDPNFLVLTTSPLVVNLGLDLSLRAGILTLGPNPLPWIIGPAIWAPDNNNSPLGMVGLGMGGLPAIDVALWDTWLTVTFA